MSGSSKGARRDRTRSEPRSRRSPPLRSSWPCTTPPGRSPPPDLFTRVVQGLEGADGAVPVLAVADTVLRVRDEVVEGVESREELVLGQTPQAFRTAALREAHAKAEAAGAAFTDDASMLRWAGYEVRAVAGDPENMKITTLADLAYADRRMGTGGG